MKEKNTWANFSQALVGDEELSTEMARLMSLLCLLIAAALGMVTYQTSDGWLRTSTVTYQPNLFTTFIALALILPLYVRNIVKWYKFSLFFIFSFVLNVSVTASIVSMVLGGSSDEGWFGGSVRMQIDWQSASTIVLFLAVMLSWLGMRLFAGLGWVVVFLVGVINLALASSNLGFFGAVFLLSSFVGIVLQNNISPGGFYEELKMEFAGKMDDAKGDVKVFKNSVPNFFVKKE